MGEEVYNFSIPGGNINTLKDLFWTAAKNKNLKEVYLQFVFLNFNKNVTYDLMEFVRKFQSKPLRYLYDKEIIVDTWSLLYYHITKDSDFVNIEKKEENIDLWKRAEKLTVDRLDKYEFPIRYSEELEKIANYCRANHIKLYVIQLPTHDAFLEKVNEKGLMEEYELYNKIIYKLGETVNLDTFKSFNSNRNNFKDYYHYKNEILDSITRMTWHGVKLARDNESSLKAQN
jgi:hypothetical protein